MNKIILLYMESRCGYCKRIESLIDKYASKKNIIVKKFYTDKKEGLEDIKEHLDELPYYYFI